MDKCDVLYRPHLTASPRLLQLKGRSLTLDIWNLWKLFSRSDSIFLPFLFESDKSMKISLWNKHLLCKLERLTCSTFYRYQKQARNWHLLFSVKQVQFRKSNEWMCFYFCFLDEQSRHTETKNGWMWVPEFRFQESLMALLYLPNHEDYVEPYQS